MTTPSYRNLPQRIREIEFIIRRLGKSARDKQRKVGLTATLQRLRSRQEHMDRMVQCGDGFGKGVADKQDAH